MLVIFREMLHIAYKLAFKTTSKQIQANITVYVVQYSSAWHKDFCTPRSSQNYLLIFIFKKIYKNIIFLLKPRWNIGESREWERTRSSRVFYWETSSESEVQAMEIGFRDTTRKSEKHELILVVSRNNPCRISDSPLHFISLLKVRGF